MPENKPYGAIDAYRSPNGNIYLGDVTVQNGDSVQDAYIYVRPGFGKYGHVTYKNGEEVEFPTSQNVKYARIFDADRWLNSHAYNDRTIVVDYIDGVEINTHGKKTDVYASGKLAKVDVSEGSSKNSVFISHPENAVVKLGEGDKLEAATCKACDGGIHINSGLYIINPPNEWKNYNGVRSYPESNPVYRMNILGF